MNWYTPRATAFLPVWTYALLAMACYTETSFRKRQHLMHIVCLGSKMSLISGIGMKVFKELAGGLGGETGQVEQH